MKKQISFVLCVLFFVQLYAQDNSKRFKGWKKTETEHFTFIYEDAQREATEGFVKIADDAWNKVAKIYSIPQNKTNVYITGRTNTVNALTTSAPAEIVMYTNPLTLIDFTFRDEWQKLFFTHELIHIANFTFEDNSQFLNKFFGPAMNNFDYMNVDGWALEGLTTVLETELTDGGRGRSPFFEMEYKALTLDNGFIPYENVGMEKEPPYGQSYVMGYLIMRSIADNYGLEALADIERNRSWGSSWGEAVLFVTGKTAQDFYRDVRISLAKKYNAERTIPEGLIISPRDLNTCYYKPAIVLDDGTIIALRAAADQDNAVVKLNPGAKHGRNYIQDNNPIFKETILFSTSFENEECVTADENENVYVIAADQRADRAPGVETEMSLYKWNSEDGIKRLTKGSSYFHPSVSRKGNVLVAIEQKGMQMRLVQIDTENGNAKVLLESKEKSYMFPAVNDDGTKVAFLEIDGKRARVAVLDLNTENVEIIANNGEQIYDPGYLSWSKEGTVLYSCNYRGRMEIFEATKDEEGGWGYSPVVSDPIGALWAYKNDVGIFYTSKSSSGDVIKIKPVDEWGVVPEFEGPSKAGEKICFGGMEKDYPEFQPYTITLNTETEDPVKHRTEENRQKAENSSSVITTMNEKKYIPFIQPYFYMPLFAGIKNTQDNSKDYGFGAFFMGMIPRVQNTMGMAVFECLYYPELQNFNASLDCLIPVFNSEIDFFANRILSFNGKDFKEQTDVQLGLVAPVVHRLTHRNEVNLSIITSASYSNYRISSETTNINGNFTSTNGLFSQAGLDFYYNKEKPKNSDINFELMGLGIGYYDFSKFYLGTEAETGLKINMDLFGLKVSAAGRYTPFPKDVSPTYSGVKYAGNSLDCSIAGYLVPRFEFIINGGTNSFDFITYVEKLASFDSISDFNLQENTSFGFEMLMSLGLMRYVMGTSFLVESGKETEFKFYFTLKYGWLRI